MANRIDQLIPAKFKNVPFYIRNESLKGVGQDRVEHKYPKSGIRYSEPMGVSPFESGIDIFFSGENFRDDFEKFKRAAEDPAPGRLYMPTFGIFNGVVVLPFDATASQTSVGEISATVTFQSTIDKPSPLEADISERDVAQKAQEARETLKETFEESYSEPDTLNNLQTVISDSNNLADEVEKPTRLSRAVASFKRKLDSAVRNAQDFANLLLSYVDPVGFLQTIAVSITESTAFSIYTEVAKVGGDLTASMNDIKEDIIPQMSTIIPISAEANAVIDFAIALWPEDTVERINRNILRLTNVNTFRLTGLIGMFEAAANKVFTTTEDVDKVTEVLNEYYEGIVENDTTGVVIPEMKESLNELRNITNVLLTSKRQQAFTVTEVKVQVPTSSKLLSYKLYGEYIKNEDQLNYFSGLIAGLNKQQPPHILQGIVKVVEVGRG